VRNVSSSFRDRLHACGVIFDAFSCKFIASHGDSVTVTADGSSNERSLDVEIEIILLVYERVSIQLVVNCLVELIYNPFSLLKDELIFVIIVADGPFSHSRPSSLRLSFFGSQSDENKNTDKMRIN